MKSTWPPPQVILVGLEPNQQGHAASHEQASSSCPVIFHGVLSFGSSTALAVEAKQKNATASTPNDERRSDVVFMCKILQPRASRTTRFCGFGRLGIVLAQRVTRLELATSSLARTQERHQAEYIVFEGCPFDASSPLERGEAG